MTPLPAHGLYAITADRFPDRDRLLREVDEALRGGAVMVQLRDKSGDPGWRLECAHRLRDLCRRYGAPLIINDDIELAQACDADGVHLGEDDPDPREARQRLGEGAIVGVSCYDRLDRAHALAAQGADYLAFGSVFSSATKPGAVSCGLDTLNAAASIGLPLVAIGGITAENGGAALRAGASFLAVISQLFEAPDVRRAAAAFAALWQAEPTQEQGSNADP